MLGLMMTSLPFLTKRSMPPMAAMARRVISRVGVGPPGDRQIGASAAAGAAAVGATVGAAVGTAATVAVGGMAVAVGGTAVGGKS